MKIKSIKISNVLSFKHYDDLSQCQEIKFCSDDSDFHILIGPNGSGKSNFLEIINQIFKNILFRRCQFNKNLFLNKSSSAFEREKRQILQSPDQNISYLNKNWLHNDKPQKILLSLLLNENDYKNLDFVVDNAQAIDEYLQTYSNFGAPNFTILIGDNTSAFKVNLRNQNIDIYLSRNTEVEKFIVSFEEENDEKKFIKQYLEYFEFLRSVIDIHNLENPQNTWAPLKETFTLIGCYRNYNTVDPNYPANQPDENNVLANIVNQHRGDNTFISTNEEPAVFKLVKHKFSYLGRWLVIEHGKEKAIKKIREQELYKNINSLLNDFLGIDLIVDLPQEGEYEWRFTFHIKQNDQIINFQNLSAGQKGIVHLIFALYGYDVENGLFIIDEPELHLHPQLQRKYIAIAKLESQKRDIQFIISTHSPIFVSEKTIGNIKRFYFDIKEKTSKIVQPDILEDDKFLIRVLNYTNASKLFFVNRAILVEGESDEYFLNFYIDHLKENDTEKSKKFDDFEIYNIEGKGEYKKWSDFLKKWGLKVAFIGDWDNVVDFNLITKEDLDACKRKLQEDVIQKIAQNIGNKHSEDGKALLIALFSYVENKDEKKFEELKQLCLYLFNRFTPYEKIRSCLQNDSKLETVNTQIESKYADGVYILKNGELEDYLDTQEKGLSGVIKFCKKFEIAKLKNKEELIGIVTHIFNDQ